jgi:hypothetical protein
MARSRNQRSWVVEACAGLLTLALVGGCELGSRDPEPVAATVPPTTAGMSMAEYAGRLDAQAKRIKSTMAQVSAVRSHADLQLNLEAARLTVRDVANGLGGLTVPAGADAGHDRFVALLNDLEKQLGNVADAAYDQEVCAPRPVMAKLNASGVTRKLDAAGKELASVTGGLYEPVEFVPSNLAKGKRPTSGTVVRRPTGSGRNVVEVDNRRKGLDIVVTLVKGKRPVFSMYVRSKSKATFTGIPDGTYTVYVANGLDWDRKLRAFARYCSFERFRGASKFNIAPTYHTLWEFWMTDEAGPNDNGFVSLEAPGPV